MSKISEEKLKIVCDIHKFRMETNNDTIIGVLLSSNTAEEEKQRLRKEFSIHAKVVDLYKSEDGKYLFNEENICDIVRNFHKQKLLDFLSEEDED